MNQTIFVHANSKSLPPLTEVSSTSAGTEVQNSDIAQSVGAVIRPARPASYPATSERSSSSSNESVPAPHIRTNKLEDYVQWLKNHAAANQKRKSPEHYATADVVMPAADEVSPEFDNYIPKPSRGFSIDKMQRIDGAHQSIKAPTTPADQFPVDPELQKIHAAMISDEVPENIDAQSALAGQKSTTPSTLQTVESEKIIRTVAQAIASVLTDQSEQTVEQKLRSQLEQEMHEAALNSLPSEDMREISAAVGQAVAGQPVESAPESTSPTPHSQTLASDKDIPLTTAAWDVADFRWPAVTSQMIVSGSDAIAQLANSVFKMMGTNQRLAITSPGRGEGTTSVAISLARWVAASGKKVLLVDADLASPGLTGQVGLGPNISWINAVSNTLDPCEVIIRSQKTPVCIMPMTPIVTRVTWPRFIYDSLGALTDQVASSFDLIIFDVGPASQLLVELSQPSLMIDTGLIVHNGMDLSNFQKTKDQLRAFGISKFLVAQNSVQQSTAHVA